MALQFALNTAAYPTLTQVLFATSDGLFDYKAQQVTSKVTIAPNKVRQIDRARTLVGPGGQKYLIES